jgi:hypothetical protein
VTVPCNCHEDVGTNEKQYGFHGPRIVSLATRPDRVDNPQSRPADPELWNRPSREAVTFAVNALWKRND